MPDISKCTNKECPLSKKSYRFTVPPNEYRQSYCRLEPKMIKGIWECEYFYKQSPKKN